MESRSEVLVVEEASMAQVDLLSDGRHGENVTDVDMEDYH